MQGWKFYHETAGSNVVAIVPATACRERYADGSIHTVYDGVGSVFTYENSPVASTSVADVYLQEDCVPIAEAEARVKHPALFAYLDAPEWQADYLLDAEEADVIVEAATLEDLE